jgi:hypothetical protein
VLAEDVLQRRDKLAELQTAPAQAVTCRSNRRDGRSAPQPQAQAHMVVGQA